MKQRRDVDRLLSTWSEDAYSPPAPPYLTTVLERTRRTKQRRAWASLERWLPMIVTTDRPAAPRALRLAWILLIVVALLAVAAGVAVVGGRLLAPSPVIPQGGAAVLALTTFENDTGGGDVFTFKADGSDLRQLTGRVAGTVTSGAGIESVPAWSHDGRRIAFRNWYNGNDLIEVMNAGGADRVVLSQRAQGPDQGCGDRTEPVWSPDGRTILYTASDVCDGPHTIFAVSADGSAPPIAAFAASMSGLFPEFSPDGRQVAFVGSEAGGTPGLFVADLGSAGALAGGLQARHIGPAAPSVFGGNRPRWSPDGKQIAIHTGTAPGETSDVVIVNVDGTGQRVLTSDKAFNPIWSPAGTRVAFQRIVAESERFQNRPCTMRLWVINADGSGERQLDPLTDGCDSSPVWSPDGTRLLAGLIVDDAFHAGVVNVDSGEPPVVLPDGVASWQPLGAPLPPAPSFAASPAP